MIRVPHVENVSLDGLLTAVYHQPAGGDCRRSTV
jgi:hypothetical protein